MTARYLLDALKKELETVLKETDSKENISVFVHGITKQDIDDEKEPFPYVLIRIKDGVSSGTNESTQINLILIIGVKEESLEIKGHELVLNIMQKIINRFCKNNLLSYFSLEGDIKWQVYSDDDTYPYFFGGMEMTFITHTINRNNESENELL